MKTIGGLLLAAGRSSRMPEGCHKLLAEFNGVPLVRRSAETMLRSDLRSVTVVTGHRSPEIQMALNGLPVFTTYNKNFAEGMGTSLACGFRHASLASCDGVLVMLADMPEITEAHIAELLSAFRSGQDALVRGADGEKPGHPVIVPSAIFSQMKKLDGDHGGKEALQRREVPVTMINIGKAALKDIDTVQDLLAAGGELCSRGE
ncbi:MULTISPECIES: nucleotidyltransferase family protein [Rhizobium]|uniref:nucleotidyltransferase family protein n=1 Tax=Rhizobium TaxID=379 RepID=UPI0028B237D1